MKMRPEKFLTTEELLEGLRNRHKGGGIITADSYLSSIAGCFDGGFCPQKYFKLATPGQWLKELNEAADKFTFSAPGMEVVKDSTTTTVSAPHTVMEFDAVLTTPRQDRDNDILESAGCTVDPKMPGLWQHCPFEPIGKYLATTRQNKNEVRFRGSLADIQLGRDAAVLVEYGALRISHGFRPLEYEPIFEEGKETDRYAWPIGFHILKFYVMEWSLVSIPSNEDAIITAHRREKLHDPLVKSWADQLDKLRKKSVSVSTHKTVAEAGTVNLRIEVVNGQPEVKNPANKTCGCKGHAMTLTKGLVPVGQNTKLAPKDEKWDEISARQDVTAWAKNGDTIDLDKFGQAFTYAIDAQKAEGFALLHHTVKDGELIVVPAGVREAMNSLLNGGTAVIPADQADRSKIYAHLAEHYKQMGESPPAFKTAVSYEAGKKADKGESWNASKARKQFKDAATSGDGDNKMVDWKKYQRGFAWYDDDGTKDGDYKFPHHYLDNGELVTVFRGCAAVIASLNGSRGGSNLDEEGRKAVHAHIEKHYAQFEVECPPLKSAQDIEDDPKSFNELFSEYVRTAPLAQKKMSKKTEEKIRDSKTYTDKVRNDSSLDKTHRVLLDKSVNLLDEVLEMQGATDQEDLDANDGEVRSLQLRLLAALTVAGENEIEAFKNFHRSFGDLIAAIDCQLEEQGIEKEFAELVGS